MPPSQNLSETARMIKNPPSQPKIPMPTELAAADNLASGFFGVLYRLGIEVVIVRFQAAKDSPIWEYPGIERLLEQELQAVPAGQFDSEVYTPGSRWLFFHVTDLGKSMQTLKRGLEARGLLETTTLLHAESAQELRVWYPDSAELLNLEDEDEA